MRVSIISSRREYVCQSVSVCVFVVAMFQLSSVAGLSSTIVETVSLDVDDFSESFLTCGTCLQVYDALSHSPKLLPCSHTVCLNCARVLAEGTTRPRCPVCNCAFVIPATGPAALPPSFVVNQLLDLMSSSSRRDVVPKCARHVSCELLFCETCDTVFCTECDLSLGSASHNSTGATSTLTSSSAAHNVVPFAIAIRRVSEILQFKAGQCTRNLDAAAAAVQLEMSRLDEEAERCVETVSRAFIELRAAVDQRQRDVIATIRRVCHDKTSVLDEQLSLVAAERHRSQAECHGLPPDVRAITMRISKLNELLDASLFLGEPRENSYVEFSDVGNEQLFKAILSFGAVRTSETFPALCTLQFTDPFITINIPSKACILTYDAQGRRQTIGGDPVSVELLDSCRQPVPVIILDVGDGTYEVKFTVVNAGSHSLTVRIFDRIVGSSSPFTFTASAFHRPLATFVGLHQPVAVALDGDMMYVLDTGNSRVAVFDVSQAAMPQYAVRSIINESLAQRGATGMSFIRADDSVDGSIVSSLYVINWRTSRVSLFTTSAGVVVHSFDCAEFVEPTSLCVASDDGMIFVADNGVHVIFVFAACGKLLRKIELMGTGNSQSDLITCIYAVSTSQELLVCDHRVRALSYSGEILYELPVGDSRGRGQYGGVVVDHDGRYLVSRSERGRSMVQVFSSDRRWLFSIECEPEARLRRPSGLAVDNSGHVYVADLGNNCIRKFQYI